MFLTYNQVVGIFINGFISGAVFTLIATTILEMYLTKKNKIR